MPPLARPPKIFDPEQQTQYLSVPNPHDHYDAYDDSDSDSRESSGTHTPVHLETSDAVARGDIGGAYGPYSHYLKVPDRNATTRYSAAYSEASHDSHESTAHLLTIGPAPRTNAIVAQYDMREPEPDDELHWPDPKRDRYIDRHWTPFSSRGWINCLFLVALVLGIVTLFAGYPLVSYFTRPDTIALLLTQTNSSGQLAQPPNMPSIIDSATPQSAHTRTGFDGKSYHLVFSDEFNVDGRTFYPGDDPYWEAVDLHYWPTNDLEWYDPGAVMTQGGALVITMTNVQNHDLNYMSGMLQSWNKLCFTGGYIEAAISMPGSPDVSGFWPSVWTMGNLGRPGYGASTEGTWPYSYEHCDVGTLPNQTAPGGQELFGPDGTTPLSYQPGQRLSACGCAGADHPGPSASAPRSAPEIDIIEGTVDLARSQGVASQSFQLAPYNAEYMYNNASPAVQIYDDTRTKLNTYTGAPYQQALSALADFNNSYFQATGGAFGLFAFEYQAGDDGYITWAIDGQPTWTLNAAALAGDATSGIAARTMPREPMSIVINLGMSENFQRVEADKLQFPAQMRVDYVRVYQRDGEENVGCEPKGFPTQDYISRHANAYNNPNLTTWADAGNTFPTNSLLHGGC